MYKNAVLSLVERNEIIPSELNFLWSLYFTCFVSFIFPNCLQGTLLHYKNSKDKHIFRCTFSKLLLFVGFQIIIQYQLMGYVIYW